MDILRRLFGGEDTDEQPERPLPRRRDRSPDERAVERYRYVLRTAPPETIEEAHAEAFAQLTPEQRQIVLRGLSQSLTPAEQAAVANVSNDPRQLARLATRAEMRQPGALERTWSTMPAMSGIAGAGMGGFMMSNFLSTFAGVMLGSVVADAFLGNDGYDQGYADGVDAASTDAPEGQALDSAEGTDGDAFGDFAGDAGGVGDFGGDFGGDF